MPSKNFVNNEHKSRYMASLSRERLHGGSIKIHNLTGHSILCRFIYFEILPFCPTFCPTVRCPTESTNTIMH